MIGAVLTLVAERGLDAVSVREVAATGGGEARKAATDAHLLASLVDGLALSAVSAPGPDGVDPDATRTLAALDRALDRVLGGP